MRHCIQTKFENLLATVTLLTIMLVVVAVEHVSPDLMERKEFDRASKPG